MLLWRDVDVMALKCADFPLLLAASLTLSSSYVFVHHLLPAVLAPATELQDSGAIGAGYEPAIKEGGLAAAGKPKSRPASKPGTKKVG